MNNHQSPKQRPFPDTLLRQQKQFLMSEVARDKQAQPHQSGSRVLHVGIGGALTLAALAVVALIVVSITMIGGEGPLGVDKALAAIDAAEGQVLHIKISGADIDGTAWVEEIWSRRDSPWKYRWVMSMSGQGPQEYVYGADGLHQTYDGKTNSLLEQRDGTTTSGDQKIEGQGYQEIIRWLLTSGRAKEDGHERVDGRDAIRFVETCSPEEGVSSVNVYLVDAKTGDPIEYRMLNQGYTLHFDVYEKLPGTQENLRLLDMTAHPGATVYTDWKAFERAIGQGGS